MSNYRQADRKIQWYQDDFPGADLHLSFRNMVVVIHTTEGMDWPGYNGGSEAPNYTGKPPLGLRGVGHWRAHFPDEKSSRALVNLQGGVETNTLNALQIELIGTCNPAHAKSWDGKGRYLAGRDYVYWPKANFRQRRWLARMLADQKVRHNLRLRSDVTFKAYPKSYGKNNGVRLSPSQWSNTNGVVGHQHVPENVHGDPGNINISSILYWARWYYRLTRQK